MPIGSNLAYFSQTIPEKPAIYYKDEIIRYKEFHQQVQTLKTQLRNFIPNESEVRIGMYLENEPHFLSLFFAIISLGWVAVPMDPKSSEEEVDHIINEVHPNIIITTDYLLHKKELTSPLYITMQELNKTNVVSQLNKYEVQDRDPFYIGFTSGSTGTPKAFIRNHTSWLASFAQAEEIFQYGSYDVIMAPGPLCHSLSLFGAIHALHIGASFYLMGTFSASLSLRLIHQGEIGVMYAVPTMLHRLANESFHSDQPVLFLSSGASLKAYTKNKLKQTFPSSTIYEYFGASELSFVTYASEQIKQIQPESVGKVFPGVKVTIRDEQRNIVPSNTVGEIYAQSDFLFSSYINNEQATNEVLTAHGATIGDLGYLDESNYLTVVGRKDNMLIVGGQNVFPEEIEHILKFSTNVQDAVIIGKKDAYWGSKLIAIVQIKEEYDGAIKQLKSLCKIHLPIYKRPRRYIVTASLPYTKTGKIARMKIKENLSRWFK